MESGSPSIEHAHRVRTPFFFFLACDPECDNTKQQFSFVLELCSPTETKENMFKVTLYVALIRGEEEIKK